MRDPNRSANPKPHNLDRIMAHQYVGPESPSIEDLANAYRCWGMTPEIVRVMLENQGISLRAGDGDSGKPA